jgi:hypothetical protein
MEIVLSDNYITVEISTHANERLFTQNKPLSVHPKFGRLFVGHSENYFDST